MAREDAGVAAAERALERLFRLSMGRRLHDRQSEAVGASVTRSGYALLRILDGADGVDGVTMGELAREGAMDPAAAARHVAGLARDGLVERRAGDDDGRVTIVHLTDAGRDVYRRVAAVRTAHMRAVLAGWSAADRMQLARLVDRLVDDLRAVPFRPTRVRVRSRR